MSRIGRQTPLDPRPEDVYTLLDGSEWMVLAAEAGVVKLEELRTAVVNVVQVPLSDLLVAVDGWRRACPLWK